MREGGNRKQCFLGFGATILKGVTVGDNVIIGAGSLVTPRYSCEYGCCRMSMQTDYDSISVLREAPSYTTG